MSQTTTRTQPGRTTAIRIILKLMDLAPIPIRATPTVQVIQIQVPIQTALIQTVIPTIPVPITEIISLQMANFLNRTKGLPSPPGDFCHRVFFMLKLAGD